MDARSTLIARTAKNYLPTTPGEPGTAWLPAPTKKFLYQTSHAALGGNLAGKKAADAAPQRSKARPPASSDRIKPPYGTDTRNPPINV